MARQTEMTGHKETAREKEKTRQIKRYYKKEREKVRKREKKGGVCKNDMLTYYDQQSDSWKQRRCSFTGCPNEYSGDFFYATYVFYNKIKVP